MLGRDFLMRRITLLVFVAAITSVASSTVVRAQSHPPGDYDESFLSPSGEFVGATVKVDPPPSPEPRSPAAPAFVTSPQSETDDLPEMPVPKTEEKRVRRAYDAIMRSPPLAGAEYGAQNLPYWAVTSAVVGSNVAAIELLQSCLAVNRCGAIPSVMRHRPAMYATGLGIATVVSGVGYYLRRSGNRWWFVPGALATTFDLVFVAGAAVRLR
jgi:hypothetical protein